MQVTLVRGSGAPIAEKQQSVLFLTNCLVEVFYTLRDTFLIRYPVPGPHTDVKLLQCICAVRCTTRCVCAVSSTEPGACTDLSRQPLSQSFDFYLT
jgi:hypothetical protein